MGLPFFKPPVPDSATIERQQETQAPAGPSQQPATSPPADHAPTAPEELTAASRRDSPSGSTGFSHQPAALPLPNLNLSAFPEAFREALLSPTPSPAGSPRYQAARALEETVLFAPFEDFSADLRSPSPSPLNSPQYQATTPLEDSVLFAFPTAFSQAPIAPPLSPAGFWQYQGPLPLLGRTLTASRGATEAFPFVITHPSPTLQEYRAGVQRRAANNSASLAENRETLADIHSEQAEWWFTNPLRRRSGNTTAFQDDYDEIFRDVFQPLEQRPESPLLGADLMAMHEAMNAEWLRTRPGAAQQRPQSRLLDADLMAAHNTTNAERIRTRPAVPQQRTPLALPRRLDLVDDDVARYSQHSSQIPSRGRVSRAPRSHRVNISRPLWIPQVSPLPGTVASALEAMFNTSIQAKSDL